MSVTDEMSSSWNEKTLPTILSNYELEDIFNADEFGLLYQCLFDKTYHLKRQKCSGGKKSKVRVTRMFIIMFIIISNVYYRQIKRPLSALKTLNICPASMSRKRRF